MESFLLNNNNKKRKRQLTAGHLSPPANRWRGAFLEIRKERDLQDLLLRRPQTRAEIFGRLFLVRFEGTLRRAVREELHGLFRYFNLPPRSLPDQNIPARYRLLIINKVKNPTFTTDIVQDENGEPIKVAIYDSSTGSIVPPDSFLSSVEVRFTVLDAEFWKNKGENWSRSEFNQSVLRDREGKAPILTCGHHAFRLENGRGTPGNIIFGDNSSWTKSGFRLGVLVEVKGVEEGYFNGERVQEGVSDSFRVLDRRGKEFQKPDRLDLKHKVQKLKYVGKDRASLLKKNKITTVEDFLREYYNNRTKLREILGFNSDSDKGWIAMVEHAKECDDEFFASYNGLNNTIQPPQVSMEKQTNILNPDSSQIHYPINDNANQLPPLDEVLTWISTPQDQFSNSSDAQLHMLQSNVPLGTNGGPRFVGSGSSEPNPYENDIIDQDDMSAYCGLLSTVSDFPPISVPIERISTAFDENVAETYYPLSHMTTERGNVPNMGSMQDTTGGGGLAQLEIPNNSAGVNAESNSNDIRQIVSRNDSFDPDLYEEALERFFAMPSRKVKIKALFTGITWLAVVRKRARIVPLANQTTVPAV